MSEETLSASASAALNARGSRDGAAPGAVAFDLIGGMLEWAAEELEECDAGGDVVSTQLLALYDQVRRHRALSPADGIDGLCESVSNVLVAAGAVPPTPPDASGELLDVRGTLAAAVDGVVYHLSWVCHPKRNPGATVRHQAASRAMRSLWARIRTNVVKGAAA